MGASATKSDAELDRELRALFMECGDLEVFSRKCLKIRTKEPGPLIPFVFNRSQQFLHEKLQGQLKDTGSVRAIICKGRQLGCSTLVGARFYQKTIRSEGIKTFILTHLQDATDNLFGMVERFHDNNSPLLRPTTGRASAKELTFPLLQSSYAVGTAGSAEVGRSDTIQLLHASEVSFWANADAHFAGVMSAVPGAPGTEIILESTAQGLSNRFAYEWALAIAGKSQFMPVFIPWFWDDGYRLPITKDFELTPEEIEYQETYDLDAGQMAWRRAEMIRLKDPWRWASEFPATWGEAFQSSGEGSFIAPGLVAKARRTEIKPLAWMPIIIGVDPSGGGRDDTAIIDRQGRKAGGHIYERISEPDAMAIAGRIVLLIKRIKPKKVIIDATEGNGDAICDRLIELGYGKIVEAVKFSHKAIDGENYANKRAEMYADMRDWLASQMGADIPDEDRLQAEICGPIWGPGATKHNSSGHLVIEPKEHIVKRIGSSPDGADALALTFGIPISEARPDIIRPATAPRIADGKAGY